MSFRISLGSNKPQLKAKTRAEENEKAHEEEAARKRVLAEFLEEHGDDAEESPTGPANDAPPNGAFIPQGAKRHFAGRPRSMKSGPGTLAHDPQEPFPRPAFQSRPVGRSSRFGPQSQMSQDDNKPWDSVYTSVVAKVSNLPPGTNQADVEEIFANFPTLNVANVEKIPPSGPAQRGRPSVAMKVIFAQNTGARDLDDAINKLNDKEYLGCGYYVHLDRYLGGQTRKEQRKEPFAAEWKEVDGPKGVAPTEDIGGAIGRTHTRVEQRLTERLVVTVQPPTDIATLRLIHTTIDGLIRGGMEFEAALMEDPRVKKQERFAWLFDQKHPHNIYYRWKLTQMICENPRKEIFRGHGDWDSPDHPFLDEFVVAPTELDPDAEDMDVDNEEGDLSKVNTATRILKIRSRALLIWLLMTIPPWAPLVHEIAGVSTFAVDHATEDIDEIIHILVSNILEPFCLTRASPRYNPNDPRLRKQLQNATMNGLRIVSDVALTTFRAGGAAWKFREMIGKHLLDRGVFRHLDSLPSRLDMGLVSEGQFRGDVNYVLNLWVERYLFDPKALARMRNEFNGRRKQQEEEEEARKQAERNEKARKAGMSGPKPGMNVAQIRDGLRTERNDDDDVVMIEKEAPNDTNIRPQVPSSRESELQQQQRSVPVTSNHMSQKQAQAESQEGQWLDLGSSSQQDGIAASCPTGQAARARRARPKAEDFLDED